MNPLEPVCPPISDALMKYLQETFPAPRPRLSDSDREIFFRVGQHSVVEFLQAKYNEQNHNVLRSEYP